MEVWGIPTHDDPVDRNVVDEPEHGHFPLQVDVSLIFEKGIDRPKAGKLIAP